MKGKWYIGGLAALVLTALVSVALAAPGKGEGGGEKGRGHGKGGHRPPVVFGEIVSISGAAWTVKPELPPKVKERMEGKGREMPELPASLTVTVGSSTEFYFDGEPGTASSFKAGDKVVIKLDKPMKDGGSLAEVVADPETARQFIMEKMKEHREGRGEGRGRGKGKGGGRGDHAQGPGEGPGHGRPHFGTVTAVSDASITIKPELPDFVSARLTEKGKPAPELPASVTVSLDGDTKYMKDGQKAETNPFNVGDKVAVMGGGEHPARMVTDLALVKQRMEQRKAGRE